MTERTVSERPIIFSANMVRAILAGTKTQTRRIVKPQPSDHYWEALPGYRLHVGKPYPTVDGRTCVRFNHTIPQNPSWDSAGVAICRLGAVGSRLWVREAWGIAGDMPHDPGYVEYKANCPDGSKCNSVGDPVDRWRSPIHLPRNHSRITLEITDVRVERLQDISDNDCKSEGIDTDDYPPAPDSEMEFNYRGAYAEVWDSINDEGAWEKNPWVWAISFRRIAP